MCYNDIFRLKLSSEALLGPIETNIEFPVTSKRKDVSTFSNLKATNEHTGLNHFSMTSFHNFKNSKATIIKTDQVLIPQNQKDNLSYLSKNYWTGDIRNNASPSKLNKISVPPKQKPFSNPNSSKNLYTKLK